jgi:hypothetical protein
VGWGGCKSDYKDCFRSQKLKWYKPKKKGKRRDKLEEKQTEREKKEKKSYTVRAA